MQPFLDDLKIKNDVISIWRTGGLNTLVKVMPAGLRPNPAMTVGSCTSFKFVGGRTPEEMGRLVGLRRNLRRARQFISSGPYLAQMNLT